VRTVAIIITLAAALSGCMSVDYGAMPYDTVPTVAGCPDSGGACSKGKG
jgi:uncharacterized protein YceK